LRLPIPYLKLTEEEDKWMIRNLTIRTQLILGFAVVLLFVMMIGSVAYSQTTKLHAQTEEMYNHPLQVRIAFGKLNREILNTRLGVNELMFTKEDKQINEILKQIEISSQEAGRQLDIIAAEYLGPTEDTKKALDDFHLWKIERDNTIDLALAGQIQEAEATMLTGGVLSNVRYEMLDSIKIIDDFSLKKGEELYQISIAEKEKLNNQLLVLVLSIILLIFMIIFVLLKNIRRPLKEMNEAVLAFDGGDMTSRIGYRSKNELGVLSYSINTMADSIKKNATRVDNASKFTRVMLANEDLNEFFQASLATLAQFAKAQIAAVYLLSDNKKTLCFSNP